MKINARPPWHLRTAALGGLAVILAWLVISHSLAAYLAEASPEAALWLSPGYPRALINLADRSVNLFDNANGPLPDGADQGTPQGKLDDPATRNATPTDVASERPGQPERVPGSAAEKADGAGTAYSEHVGDAFDGVDRNRSVDLAAIRGWLETALMRQPLNARALRILGQLASIGHDDAAAAKFMKVAAQLSLHESVAVYWMMIGRARAGDYKSAVAFADALLRTDPGLDRLVMPVLTHFAEDKTSNGLVKTVLDGNPPWRAVFFAELAGSMTDVRTPLDLLLALKTSPAPPTADELGSYVSFLIEHKFYDLAYYTWLQFLPPEQLRSAGLLFNGNFDIPPSGMPFDWVIKQGSGVTIDIVRSPDNDGEHVLLIDFLYGRVDYHSVTELLLLAPGTYRFSGQYKGKLAGPRGLRWRVACAGESNTRIGDSAMIGGLAANWKKIEFVFTVPAANCRAQYVRLDLDARMASEQLVSGSILFDELRISRLSNPQSAAASVVNR